MRNSSWQIEIVYSNWNCFRQSRHPFSNHDVFGSQKYESLYIFQPIGTNTYQIFLLSPPSLWHQGTCSNVGHYSQVVCYNMLPYGVPFYIFSGHILWKRGWDTVTHFIACLICKTLRVAQLLRHLRRKISNFIIYVSKR